MVAEAAAGWPSSGRKAAPPAHVLWNGASAVRAAAFISAGFNFAVALVSQRAEAEAV